MSAAAEIAAYDPPRPPGIAAFLLLAGLAHGAGLLMLAPSIWSGGSGSGGADATTVAGASAELSALVEHWNTPPELGTAAEIAAPTADTAAPDTSTAAAAEAGVDAGDASALGEATGPGKAPKRPIFAAKIKTKTTAPPKLALRAPEPMGFSAPSLAPPGGDAGIGSIGGSAGLAAAPGAALSSGLGEGSAGFALPTRPEEESFAPETAPLPRARPDPAALAAGTVIAEEVPPMEILGEIEDLEEAEAPGLPAPALPGSALPGSDLPGPGKPGGSAAGGLLPAAPLPSPAPAAPPNGSD